MGHHKEKWCSSCNEVKPIRDFYRSSSRITPTCTKCNGGLVRQPGVREDTMRQRLSVWKQRVRSGEIPGDVSLDKIGLFDYWGSMDINPESCYYCGDGIAWIKTPGIYGAHLDHVTPISRGGEHVAENIVPSCWRCNLAKGVGSPDDLYEWMNRLTIRVNNGFGSVRIKAA